jgi:hypothetical protein
MREAVDHLAAIRAMMEAAAQAPPANQTDTAPLIDQTDLLTLQQAAGLAHRNDQQYADGSASSTSAQQFAVRLGYSNRNYSRTSRT